MQNDKGLLDLAAQFRNSSDRLAKEAAAADDIAELRLIFSYHDKLVREDDAKSNSRRLAKINGMTEYDY